MLWSRLVVELEPIAAAPLAIGFCRRLPAALESGWHGLMRPGGILLRRPPSARAAPFILTGLVLGVLAATPLSLGALLGLGAFLSGMAALAVADMEWGVVPDALSQPLAGAGLAAAALGASTVSLLSAVIGGATGWICGKAMQRVCVLLSRSAVRPGIFGGGDVKLLVLIGSWLGGTAGYVALLLALSTLSLRIRIGRRRSRPSWEGEAPLAPYLFAAAAVVAAICPLIDEGVVRWG